MTRQHKILILYWDIGLGGVQKKIYDIAANLYKEAKVKEEKVVVSILLNHKNHQGLSDDLYYKKLLELGVKIKYDPGWKWRSLRFPYTLHALWTVFAEKPDTLLSFLHRHGVISVICKLLLFWRNTKVIYGQDIVLSEALRALYEKSKRIPRKWNLLVRVLFPCVNQIVAPTVAIKKDLTENFGISKNKIKVIHNWVLEGKENKVGRKIYDLLYVGRISKQKRLDRLVNIVDLLKQKGLKTIQVAVVGHGEEAGNLAYSILQRKLYDNIHLIGTSRSPVSYFNSAKIFILTSDFEGEPIALLEAMAMGTPVVVSNFKGAREVVKDGFNGFVVKSESQFFKRIKTLLGNAKLSKRMGANSIKIVQRKFGEGNLNKFTTLLLNG